jgi:hypothetical protein
VHTRSSGRCQPGRGMAEVTYRCGGPRRRVSRWWLAASRRPPASIDDQRFHSTHSSSMRAWRLELTSACKIAAAGGAALCRDDGFGSAASVELDFTQMCMRRETWVRR